MENFISEQSNQLWDLFKKTGNIGVYMLFSAVQHTPENVLDKWENTEVKKDDGMEM